ncbi:MAG: sensor histidine kinase [Alkalispirochaeta sp.]
MRLPTLTVRRALLVTTLVSIVPALAIIIATGVEHGRYLEEAVRIEAQRQVEAIAEIQVQTVDNVIRMMDTIASLPAFRSGDFDAQETILRAVLAENPEFLNMTTTDPDGFVTASPGLPRGTDLTDRVHIRTALETGGFATGEFILAKIDGNGAFPFSIPIFDFEDRLVGTLSLVFPLTTYGEFFDRLALPEETVLGITDRNGIRIFFRPIRRTNPIGTRIKGDSWDTMLTGPDRGTYETDGSDGVRRFYAYRKLYLPGNSEPYLYIVIGIPERVALAAARPILVRNVLLMVAVTIAAALVSRLLGGAVFGSRVEELGRTAALISDGDLSARTGIPRSRSEVSLVAAAIDEMAVRLEARSREREAEQQRIARSLEEKEILLKEIHHRVKNNMQLILSIVQLQKGTTTDIETFCVDLEMRISAIAGVHEMLYQSSDLSTIAMQEFFERLSSILSIIPNPPVVQVEAEEIFLRIEHAIPIALITSELLTNAAKYGAPGKDARPGTVSVSLVRQERDLVLTVHDDGPGFPPGFDPTRSEGLGMRLVTALSDQLGGTFTVGSGSGAVATVRVRMFETDTI